MTTLVAAIDRSGEVYMASDSRTIRGNYVVTDHSQKLIEVVDGVYVGGCGPVHALQTLIWQTDWRGIADVSAKSLKSWLCEVWVPRTRDLLADIGITSDQNAMLIGAAKGRIFLISDELAVTTFSEPGDYMAIGSGRDYAMTAMLLLEQIPIEERVKRAVLTASHFDYWTGGDIVVKQVP